MRGGLRLSSAFYLLVNMERKGKCVFEGVEMYFI